MGNHRGLLFLFGIPAISVFVVFLLASSQANAQFREQESWKFEDPIQKAIRLSRATSRQAYRGELFNAEATANRSISIGTVEVETATGNLTLTDQSNTNVGSYQAITQSGNGTLNVDSAQTSGTQTGSNTNTRDNSHNCMNCGN